MSDLDLGMNNWMADPFPYPEKPMARGKVLSAEDVRRLGGFARYKDVDGDGIGYRTLPGTPEPLAGYFTRGSGHNEKAIYSERPNDYVNNMDRLARKFETARTKVPKPVIQENGKREVGIIAYGTSHWAVLEALDQLKKEQDIEASYCRLRAYPFTLEVRRLHPPARSSLCGGPEPRRADAGPLAAGTGSRGHQEVAQRAALRWLAH